MLYPLSYGGAGWAAVVALAVKAAQNQHGAKRSRARRRAPEAATLIKSLGLPTVWQTRPTLTPSGPTERQRPLDLLQSSHQPVNHRPTSLTYPRLGKYEIGFCGVSARRISKCRCGPVDRPLVPTSAIF